MTKRILGILGGMGPEATVDFYREIVSLTPASRDQDHIPTLIHSNTMIPDRTAAILGCGTDPFPLLLESARLLEHAGAGIIAIPCNTAHHYLEQLREQMSVPILNMIGEVLRELRTRYPDTSTVGLLASTGTVSARIYQSAFEPAGIAVSTPRQADQDHVMTAIRDVKAGRNYAENRRRLIDVCVNLEASGAEAVVLGCTELPLLLNEIPVGIPVLNSTRILAQAAVDWALEGRQ